MYIFFSVFPVAGNNVKKIMKKKRKKKMVQVGLHHCIAIILQAKALYCKAIVLQAKALYCNFGEAGKVYCKRSLVADGLYCNIVFLAKEVYCNRRA